MYEIGCGLENDGVGQFNASGVAVCLDARRAFGNRICRTHNRAHWQCALATYRLEVSEAHSFSGRPRANGGGGVEVSLLGIYVGVG